MKINIYKFINYCVGIIGREGEENLDHIIINKDGIVSLNIKNKKVQEKFKEQLEKIKNFDVNKQQEKLK